MEKDAHSTDLSCGKIKFILIFFYICRSRTCNLTCQKNNVIVKRHLVSIFDPYCCVVLRDKLTKPDSNSELQLSVTKLG